MIIANLADCERYEALHPKLKLLFDYVKTHNLLQMPAGRVEIDGDNVFVNIDDSLMQPAQERPLEVHRRYMDVQFPLSCAEQFGWKPLSALASEPSVPYDAQRDIAFYQEGAQAYVTARPGQFYILFPEDAHAPIVGLGPIRKAVGKILL